MQKYKQNNAFIAFTGFFFSNIALRALIEDISLLCEGLVDNTRPFTLYCKQERQVKQIRKGVTIPVIKMHYRETQYLVKKTKKCERT